MSIWVVSQKQRLLSHVGQRSFLFFSLLVGLSRLSASSPVTPPPYLVPGSTIIVVSIDQRDQIQAKINSVINPRFFYSYIFIEIPILKGFQALYSLLQIINIHKIFIFCIFIHYIQHLLGYHPLAFFALLPVFDLLQSAF